MAGPSGSGGKGQPPLLLGGARPHGGGGTGRSLLLFLVVAVIVIVALSLFQMMAILQADTNNALHFAGMDRSGAQIQHRLHMQTVSENARHHVEASAGAAREHSTQAPLIASRKMALRGKIPAARPKSQSQWKCHLGGPFGGYLSGCISNCETYSNFAKAQNACLESSGCAGVTAQTDKIFQLRTGQVPLASPGGREMSYRKFCLDVLDKVPPPVEVPPPEEWHPPPQYAADPDAFVDTVEGHPTIFISIASYRDDLCHNSIREALHWAEHPRRLFFGVVEQNIPGAGDVPCDYTPKPCDQDPSELLCAHASQIRLHRVDARKALGPTFGRHRADRLYHGEAFALQVDAHTFFVRHWDTKIIEQWNATKNEYAILTTYPTDYKPGVIDDRGNPKWPTTPVICSARFEGDHMVRNNAAGEIYPDVKIVGKSPILQPVWGAGSSFSRGHRVARAPYDSLPMMFNGEEFLMGLRFWTNGYDFYTFHSPLVFHPYARKTRPAMYWENHPPPGAEPYAKRALKVLGVEKRAPENTDIEVGARYGLGTRRKPELYYRLFGFDLVKRVSRNNCAWAQSQRMHKQLVQYLREDHKGIDYSRVPIRDILKEEFRISGEDWKRTSDTEDNGDERDG